MTHLFAAKVCRRDLWLCRDDFPQTFEIGLFALMRNEGIGGSNGGALQFRCANGSFMAIHSVFDLADSIRLPSAAKIGVEQAAHLRNGFFVPLHAPFETRFTGGVARIEQAAAKVKICVGMVGTNREDLAENRNGGEIALQVPDGMRLIPQAIDIAFGVRSGLRKRLQPVLKGGRPSMPLRPRLAALLPPARLHILANPLKSRAEESVGRAGIVEKRPLRNVAL